MNTSSAVSGSFLKNPFSCQQFHLRDFRIIRSRRAIVSLDTTSPCRPCVTTIKAMEFNEGFPALLMEVFQNHDFLLQYAAEHLHYPELSGESLRLEMFFQFPLEQVTEMIVLGEKLSIVHIDKFGTVAKMFSFFELSVSHKYDVNFLRLFIVIVSVLSILFFFRPKPPEKADNECCLIENPKKLLQSKCKPVFKNLCLDHKFC